MTTHDDFWEGNRMVRRVGRLLILSSMLLSLSAAVGWTAEAEVDPTSISDELRAILQYSNGDKEVADRLNANTVTLMTGTIGGTYVQIGADLESVLDDGQNLRVLSIVGRGSVQSVADILFLKGVDLGIVRSDTLDYLARKGYPNIKKQFNYVSKLYNEEMHVIALKSIRNLMELDGKRVAIDLPNGGTFMTAITVCERLGIHPNFVYVEQRLAYDQLLKGDLDAVIAVQGKPSKATAALKSANLHLVPVEYADSLQADYLPARLSAEDYPNLLDKDEVIDTIAVPAVLAVYNWAPNSDRYRKLAHFVDVFFSKIDELQQPPFHPKWKEVSPSATIAGWVRFQPAQDWLDRHTNAIAVSANREQFGQFLGENRTIRTDRAEDREALFQRFVEWRKKHRVTH
jgi:TRAP transporter TAXI family solute receptor